MKETPGLIPGRFLFLVSFLLLIAQFASTRGFIGLRWEDAMLWRRHGCIAHAVLPQEFVQHRVVHSICVAEIEIFPRFPLLRVDFVQQPVIAVTVIGTKSTL